jgi:thiol-disulfide isomerase/thioredoxin
MHKHEYVNMEFFFKKDLLHLEKITKPTTFHNKKRDFLLTIDTFYAEWCPNCHYDVKTLKEFFNLFSEDLVDFNLNMMLSSDKDSINFIESYNLQIPFKMSNLKTKDEELFLKTTYSNFKNEVKDRRKWGFPLHIINKKEGEEVAVIKGEIIKKEMLEYLNNLVS